MDRRGRVARWPAQTEIHENVPPADDLMEGQRPTTQVTLSLSVKPIFTAQSKLSLGARRKRAGMRQSASMKGGTLVVTRNRTRFVPHRRTMQWFTSINPLFTLAANGQLSIDLLGPLAVDQRKGATITRVILDLSLFPTVVTTLHEVFWGLLVMDEEAASAGGFPDADIQSDRQHWLQRGHLISKVLSTSDGKQGDRQMMDIRSQRKLTSEEDTFRIIFDHGATGTSSDIVMFARTLIKFRT